MTKDSAVVHLIREALEGVLAPEVAASVFFDALSEPEGLPEDRPGLIRFVKGPLRDALVRKVGSEAASAAVGRILLPLEAATRPDAKRRRDDHPTRAVPLSEHPVPVSVLAAGQALATRLRAVLGPQRIESRSTPSAMEIANQRFPVPQIVIVDASDFPPIEPAQIAAAFRLLPATTARVVWCTDLPFGPKIVDALRAEAQNALGLTRAEGIEPLLDLVRSRRK
ncbi:MAG: hypothetical protein U0230_24695 [Polyangiales bacterium]